MNKIYTILLIIVIFIGFIIRIFPVEYASMAMYDNQLVTQAFDLGKGIVNGDLSILKTPAKYPYFFSYILLFFYGIFYFFGKLAGLFSSANEFINYTFFHLDKFYDFARILTGIFSAALIFLVYITTFKIVSFKNRNRARISGLLAAFLMAFNLLYVHFSHQERPHVLVGVFMFLSFYLFVLFLEKRTLIYSLLLGLSIGLVAGSLQNGLIALVFFVLILLFGKFKYLFSFKFWLGILAFLVIFVFCYPYLILSFKEVAHPSAGFFDFTLSGEKHITSGGLSSFSGRGFLSVLTGLLFYDLSLISILLLFLAIYLFLRNRQAEESINQDQKTEIFRWSIIGGISFVVLYGFVFGMYNSTYFRMLLPLIPFFCLFVGVLFNEIFYKFNKIFLKRVFAAVLILFLLFMLIQVSRFSYLMFKKETRNLAKNWIEENIPKSETIALEHEDIRFIPDEESLELQSVLAPDFISHKNEFLLSLNKGSYPKNSRSILNYWIFAPKENKYQFLMDQGAKYFVISKPGLVDVSRSGLEAEIISKGGKLLKSFSPFINQNSLIHSNFPHEFDNPILDLWALNRFGPIIEIYKL